MSNRSYSRNIVACCPKCRNAINLREMVNVTSEITVDDNVKLAKISAVEMYGVELSRYACIECGINMNSCDDTLYNLFSEFQNLPFNIISSAAIGSLGGCVGNVIHNMLDTPCEKRYFSPNIIFCNSNQDIINGLISVISDTVGDDNTYKSISLQINPISTMDTDEDGNPVESITHFQVMIFIGDSHFTINEEEYNNNVETFTKFANLILNPIAAFGVQERERVIIKTEEEAICLEAGISVQEESETDEITE